MDPRSSGRAFPWTLTHYCDPAKPLARAIFHSHWVAGADLPTPESGTRLTPAGIDPDALLAAIWGDESGRLLRAAVAQSMQLGVFGSPPVRVDGDLFFGVESSATLEDWLARGGW